MPRPELPVLSESYRNSVFTFNNQPVSNSNSNNVPSFDHLVFVGENAVQFAIMNWVRTRYPKASIQTLKRKLNRRMASKPNAWGRLYKLLGHCSVSSLTTTPQPRLDSDDSILTPPTQSPASSPSSPAVQRRSHAELFYAYAGALLIEYNRTEDSVAGARVVNQWVREIFEYEMDEGSAESGDDDEQGSVFTANPQFRYAIPPPSSSPTNVFGNVGGGTSNGTNPVSLMNELAIRKGIKVSWEESSSGPSHLSEWTSRLKFSGLGAQEEGPGYVGVGLNKKIARAAAAELALRDKSWQ